MILSLMVRTDKGEIEDPLILVDVSGEYHILDVQEDRVRLLYRSEQISRLNGRDGNLIVSIEFSRSDLSKLYSFAQVIHQLRSTLQQKKWMNYSKIKEFNESTAKDAFVKRCEAEIAGEIGSVRICDYSILDFSSPLEMESVSVGDLQVYRPKTWFSDIDRFAMAVEAIAKGAKRVGLPTNGGERFLNILSFIAPVIVVGRDGGELLLASHSKVSILRRALRAVLGKSEYTVASHSFSLSLPTILVYPGNTVPVSKEMRILAEELNVSAAAVVKAKNSLIRYTLPKMKNEWEWRMAINNAIVCVLAFGDALKRVEYAGDDNVFRLEFNGGELFLYKNGDYSMTREVTTSEGMERRLSLFHLLHIHLKRAGFKDLEAHFHES